jgi:hypothetical protein
MSNNTQKFVTTEDIYTHYVKEFAPLAITNTVLAPLTRIKNILQTMKLISINENEKIYRIRHLVPSNNNLN